LLFFHTYLILSGATADRTADHVTTSCSLLLEEKQ